MQTKGIDKINEALSQKAVIIILDGTRTIPGLYLDYYYASDSQYVKICYSLSKLMRSPPNGFIHVLYVSKSYDVKFRISSVVVKVPVGDDLRVKEKEKDKISIVA